MKEIEGPDGIIYEFPDDMPVDQIHAKLKSKYAGYKNPRTIDTKASLPYNVTKGEDKGSALGNIWESIKGAANKPLIPAEKWLRSAQPKGNTGPIGEAAAAPGIAVARLIEQLSTPSTAAIGAGAGLAGSIGLPGFILNAGLSADMIRNAWKNAMAELPKNALPRDKYANYITAVLDTAMAATPFLPARGGGKRMPAVKPGTSVKDVPLPVDAPKVSTVPLPKKVSSETARPPAAVQEKPIETREPWYEKKAREDAAKVSAEDDIFGPPPSGPLPEVSMGPKAEAMKLVEESASMRMNEIADLIETGIGGLSGKGKAVEGLENMTYAGQQGVSGGFGKIRVKGNAAMPELTGLKESPSKIAEAIRKDGNNPLYLRIKDAVSSDIKTRFADDIAAIESGHGIQTERTPEGFFDYFKTGDREPGQEGFADILPFKRKGKPVEINNRGNVIDLLEAWANDTPGIEIASAPVKWSDRIKVGFNNLRDKYRSQGVQEEILSHFDDNLLKNADPDMLLDAAKNKFDHLSFLDVPGKAKLRTFKPKDESGFADIDAKPLGDFMDSWILKHPKGGNMEVRFGENGPYIEQVRVPPEMRGKGHASDLYTHLGEMMKDRGLSGDSIQGNIQGDPAQIARLRSKAAAVAGQGKSTGDRFEVFGDEDPNDFMRRMFGGESGYADLTPEQRSKIVALSRGYERNPVLDTSLVGGAPTGEMTRYRRSMTNPEIDASFIKSFFGDEQGFADMPKSKKQLMDEFRRNVYSYESRRNRHINRNLEKAQDADVVEMTPWDPKKNQDRRVIIHRSTNEPGKWQASQFDQYGPWGHQVYSSPEEAVRTYSGDWVKGIGTPYGGVGEYKVSRIKKLMEDLGFADSKKDQAGFNFVPIDVPGQQPGQSIGDLYNQILQAPDAAISKRELLGMDKKKKRSSTATPLFENDKLF